MREFGWFRRHSRLESHAHDRVECDDGFVRVRQSIMIKVKVNVATNPVDHMMGLRIYDLSFCRLHHSQQTHSGRAFCKGIHVELFVNWLRQKDR